uniref:Testis-expressed protein 2-like n=1 Tax=Fundulus heteroclitus TaxID=8078 RepID=A0A3Q2R488_FUNHE
MFAVVGSGVAQETDYSITCCASLLPLQGKSQQSTDYEQLNIQLQVHDLSFWFESIMEDSKLIFSLDHLDEGPSVVFSKERPQTLGCQRELSLSMNLDLNQSHRTQPLYLPHSPSSPGSLSDLSALSTDLLISTGLVKSSSTDLKPKDSSTLRGKPLLSLVKSLSTEISRRGEPDNNLSKSDSKLHLHPWKQVTHPKMPEYGPTAGALSENDNWVSPLSSGSMSPAEPRGSSLIAELEDTRRKFSEAMHDPLSMLSKIMGDENSGSPKQVRGSGTGDSPSSQGGCERDRSSEDSDLRCRKRTDNEHRAVCDDPLRRLQKDSSMQSSVFPEQNNQSRDKRLEICSYGDVIQVVELQNGSTGRRHKMDPAPQVSFSGSSLPFYWLIPVGLLAYGLFVLPLPPYLTGLSMGIAFGFILGLVVVFVFAPRHSRSKEGSQSRSRSIKVDPLDGEGMLVYFQGWMNEAHGYDPDTFHPSAMHSVYVTLDGSRLHLATPRGNVPRWAAFDEPHREAVFLTSRTYQLANSEVSLVPPGLARKRVWNKKYPICITVSEGELGEKSLLEGQEEGEIAEKSTVPSHRSPATLYLFGRTGREKEEWFQHLLLASKAAVYADKRGFITLLSSYCCCPDAQSGGDTVKDSTEETPDLSAKTRTMLEYSNYMMQLIGSDRCSPTPVCNDKGTTESGGCSPDGQHAWINSLVGRIFWDFLREKYWANQVAHKIQKKLSKIKLPYFMNELTLADLDMGSCLPQVLTTSKPTLDRRGLWLDLELMYTGCLQMTLETKMNLCKLGKEGEDEPHNILENLQMGSKPRLCILVDSDEESSSAGSSDEEELPPSDPQSPLGGSTGRKILRFVDKITKSKYFQKATENEYIKKKIAEVSNMPLMLSVEVLELSGTLTINIPPPPTDRIWYSFRVPPRLDLHVRPMLGEREVTFTHVTEWIERKLQCEFQKIFVMPNMDDLYLPLMTSGLENPPASCHSSVISSSHQSSMESQEYLSE